MINCGRINLVHERCREGDPKLDWRHRQPALAPAVRCVERIHRCPSRHEPFLRLARVGLCHEHSKTKTQRIAVCRSHLCHGIPAGLRLAALERLPVVRDLPLCNEVPLAEVFNRKTSDAGQVLEPDLSQEYLPRVTRDTTQCELCGGTHSEDTANRSQARL